LNGKAQEVNGVAREVFRAICDDKWLDISYRNKDGQISHFWISISDINVPRRMLKVCGLHLLTYEIREEMQLRIDAIVTASVLDGTFSGQGGALREQLTLNPSRYAPLFGCLPNLRVLSYLSDCRKLDADKYCTKYGLIESLDADSLSTGRYKLSDHQFSGMVKTLAEGKGAGRISRDLALNVLSIHTNQGLYVLAFRRLSLDVKKRTLRLAGEVVVCREFIVNRELQIIESVQKFLDAEDRVLLKDFIHNQELIKDRIHASGEGAVKVDDMPYTMVLASYNTDVDKEYAGILRMYQTGAASVPIKAFFGELLRPPRRRQVRPLTLIDRQVSLDQLRAISNAISQPLTYVQGPPGTGKTKTIANTVLSAFCVGKTVLISSHNNLPVENICERLSELRLGGTRLPLPLLRIGNNQVTAATLDRLTRLLPALQEEARAVEDDGGSALAAVLAGAAPSAPAAAAAAAAAAASGPVTPAAGSASAIAPSPAPAPAAEALAALLKRYEDYIDLEERRAAIEKLIETVDDFRLQTELQAVQLNKVNADIAAIGRIDDEDALALLPQDSEDDLRRVQQLSLKCLRRLLEPRFAEFRKILSLSGRDQRVQAFNGWLSDGQNLTLLLKAFPVVATTCLSARRLADPSPHFDLTIIDEASQCDTASALIAVVRGKNLMLVGDPQQLSPISKLDDSDNLALKKKYSIPDAYDYNSSSIYKTYLICDSVSNEILLRNHYRCAEEIVAFSNRKYYNNRLQVKTAKKASVPLVFINVEDDSTTGRNTAPGEARAVIEYTMLNRDKDIGIITPFKNQRQLLARQLKEQGLDKVSCGTVHAFQGDEKDVIIVSLGLTRQTGERTYAWLRDNREIINVATTRAREQLVLIASEAAVEALHLGGGGRGGAGGGGAGGHGDAAGGSAGGRDDAAAGDVGGSAAAAGGGQDGHGDAAGSGHGGQDDVYELLQYVRSRGKAVVTGRPARSRALGIKPYSTATEEAFLANINHAISNIDSAGAKRTVKREVPISHVFCDNPSYADLFYSGRFDFVVYEQLPGSDEMPVLAVELDGLEHYEEDTVRARDVQKSTICRDHGFTLLRVDNSYARRYIYIKELLIKWLTGRR
jgi:superfamily I DNA/RNA helicase